MRVFIGWDSRFPEAAQVLAYSMQVNSSIPLDIRFLELNHLKNCYQFEVPGDPLASTEFTYSRFLVPYLCDYEGKALFTDNDMICLGDLKELDDLSMEGYALRVVKHDHNPVKKTKMHGCVQTTYPRKNWSSLMLMDCSKLKAWTKEVVEEGNGARLHRFQDISDEQIGDIDYYWNHLDTYVPEKTKLIHWTSGGPWNDNTKVWPYQDIWFKWLSYWKCKGLERQIL